MNYEKVFATFSLCLCAFVAKNITAKNAAKALRLKDEL